jgi:rod shape-determining protein MreD
VKPVQVVRHVLLLLVVFVLQTTWGYFFDILELRPDLILLALVYVALRVGPFEATILGFGVGLLQDAYMPQNLGLNTLVKSLVGFGVGYGRTGIMADDLQVQAFLVFGVVLVHDLIYYLGYSGLGFAEAPFFWLRYGVGRALYTSLIGCGLAYVWGLRRRLLPV